LQEKKEEHKGERKELKQRWTILEFKRKIEKNQENVGCITGPAT
jgi:hypothetical protein